MKEFSQLSIEQKAKRYEEAIARANELIYVSDKDSLQYHTVCHIFPELKDDEDDEDERIREVLVDYFKRYKEQEECGIKTFFGIPTDNIITWLEKQCEQKPQGKTALEAINEEKVDNANNVEPKDYNSIDPNFMKPVDKVESKFHKGDWVVNNDDGCICQITSIREDDYCLWPLDSDVEGYLKITDIDNKYHLYTIKDAKVGDMLACNEEVLLFKSYSVQGRISLYCWYNGQTNIFHSKEAVDTLITTRNKICPATKEQRDKLKKAMADAGYTFDFERKELTKVIGYLDCEDLSEEDTWDPRM